MTVSVAIPGSKSLTHRALLLGALSSGPCRVSNPLIGADCLSTLGVLEALGARTQREGDDILFEPIRDLHPTDAALDCGNSGTTLRLMLAQVARLEGSSTLTGDASLRGRPNATLLAALESLGARVRSEGGRAPVIVRGPIRAGRISLPSKGSSQYASGLLLALPLLHASSQLFLEAPISSRPYLDLTRQTAAAFGLELGMTEEAGGLRFTIPGGQRPRAASFTVEGDWSTAAFPLVGGAIAGQPVRLRGLRADSVQGDRAIVEIMRRFGLEVEVASDEVRLEPRERVAPGAIDLGATPDLFPALCALAARTEGTTVLRGAPSLRHKECDRIAAMVRGLRQLGLSAEERPDGAQIVGKAELGPSETLIQSEHDHRVYMAFSVLGLGAKSEITVDGAGCEAVSYPGFGAMLGALREAIA
ncbi:MAG: 3-phosphoshikimate 1-carboxyvinyltransferase [Deltaproteobacteria bacterium]|nr:MAG: 3-phosphoshikimate 1-carboxyvinyltransferase [Deltaproteobacteria bacterium]